MQSFTALMWSYTLSVTRKCVTEILAEFCLKQKNVKHALLKQTSVEQFIDSTCSYLQLPLFANSDILLPSTAVQNVNYPAYCQLKALCLALDLYFVRLVVCCHGRFVSHDACVVGLHAHFNCLVHCPSVATVKRC